MKKRIAVIGCLLTLLALAGCGSGNGGETTAPETTAASNGIESSLALLTTVWESWPEESKFAVAGGCLLYTSKLAYLRQKIFLRLFRILNIIGTYGLNGQHRDRR